MSKKHPLTPEEIQAIADAVAARMPKPHPAPYVPYWIDPRYVYPGQIFRWTSTVGGISRTGTTVWNGDSWARGEN